MTGRPELTHHQASKNKILMQSRSRVNQYTRQEQERKVSSYSQRHQQKLHYRAGNGLFQQVEGENMMDYRSDGQLNLEARSLMMMIPDNTGAIG